MRDDYSRAWAGWEGASPPPHGIDLPDLSNVHVGLDALALGDLPVGVGRYIRLLLRGLVALDRPPRLTAFTRAGVRASLRGLEVRGPGRLFSVPALRPLWEQAWLPLVAHVRGVDLLHGLMGVVPLASRLPRVVTIHDVTFFTHPDLHERRKAAYFQAVLPRTARAARIIVTDSEASRAAIVRELRVSPEVVRTVPLAVDQDTFHPMAPGQARPLLRKLGVMAPYVLYAGVLEPRKNLPRLIEAVLRLRARGLSTRLVLAGKPGWNTAPIVEAIARAGPGDPVLTTGYVSDHELRALFAGAAAFAYVPVAEGFGLPVAEALACGVPVVTSNCSSLPEVAGGAALLVDPTDPEAIADALARILSSPELRADLVLRGLRRAAELTPEALARGTMAAWADALA